MKDIHDMIPGGGHTYSKGDDQFPANAPKFIARGKGCYLWDENDNKFLDFSMSLGTVTLGHAYEPVLKAVREEILEGVNFCRPSIIEGKLAEILIDEIPSAEMVKFGKHGSDAVTGAVKLARAYTGRNIVVRCEQDPFNAVHDWFIGSTVVSRGVPDTVKNLTLKFNYNDLDQCVKIFEKFTDQIACFVLEPLSFIPPTPDCSKFNSNQKNCSCSVNNCKSKFLIDLKELCEKNGSLLIFDEVVSGFRFDIGGVQKMVGVTPHLSAFGKAMANGFSISALVGQKEIMQLGGIKHNKEKVFLMSSTHGGETHSIAASIATIECLKQANAIDHFWNIGNYFISELNRVINITKTNDYIEAYGFGVKPIVVFKNKKGEPCSVTRTFFLQETIDNGILMPFFVPSLSHTKVEIDFAINIIEKILIKIYKNNQSEDLNNYLLDSPIKPVFRKYN